MSPVILAGSIQQLDKTYLGGAKATTMAVSEQMGKEFGANGVEISAHGACALTIFRTRANNTQKKSLKDCKTHLQDLLGDNNCHTHTLYHRNIRAIKLKG